MPKTAPRATNESRRLTIQIPADLDQQLEEATGKTRLQTKSAVVRMALERGLPIVLDLLRPQP